MIERKGDTDGRRQLKESEVIVKMSILKIIIIISKPGRYRLKYQSLKYQSCNTDKVTQTYIYIPQQTSRRITDQQNFIIFQSFFA